MLTPFLRCSARTPRFFPSLRIARPYASTPTHASTTTPKARAAGNVKPLARAVPPTPKPIPANIIQARNKTAIVEQILNAGREEIYKAPSHVGLLFTAWAVFASGTLCCLYFVNSGFLDAEEMKTRGLPFWVSPVYKGVMLFMGLCSGIFLAQSFSFISAIRIVRDAGAVKLLVSQRPWFPLWRHHRFLVEPSQLSIDRRVAFLAQSPGAGRTEVAQQALAAQQEGGVLKKIAVTPFLIMRKLFFHEGVLKVVIPTGKGGNRERWVRLDLDGHWSNNGKDLLDIATIRS